MKKIVFADFVEYNDPSSKLGNYHYCNAYVNDGYEAMWISNSFNQLIYLKDKEDYRFKKSISTAERHELAPNVYGFSAYAWRLYGNYLFSRNAHIALNQQKYIMPKAFKALSKLQFDEVDTLWISNPKLYWLTNVLKYERLVYRIADDYTKFKEFPNIERVECNLIKKADLVLVTSNKLMDKVKNSGKQPHLISNGVQFDHFSMKVSDMPEEYKSSKRPKVVYVGAIKYWLDVELIRRLAAEVDAEIYLIGHVEADLSALERVPNVHILGSRAYTTIPGYLKHANVAIIPFKKNEATDAVSPIKLYEYCSAGIAVVTSDMEEVKRTRAPVYVAQNADEFIQAVRRYLKEGYDSAPLIEFGRDNSWKKRYEHVQQIIQEKEQLING